MPAERVVVRVGVDMRVPHVVILRIVEQVVDQRVAVIVVHRAVGEHVALEAGQHRVARRAVDDHRVAHMAHRGVDQAEVERDGVVAAERVDAHVAGQQVERVIAGRAEQMLRVVVLDRRGCAARRKPGIVGSGKVQREGLIGLVRAIGVDHHGDRLGSLAGIEDECSADRREVVARDRRAAVGGRVIEPHVRNARVVERDREGDGGGAACALGLAHVADRNRRQVADIGDVCAGQRRECERGIDQDRRPAREIEDADLRGVGDLCHREMGQVEPGDIDAPGVGGRIEGEETRKVVARCIEDLDVSAARRGSDRQTAIRRTGKVQASGKAGAKRKRREDWRDARKIEDLELRRE